MGADQYKDASLTGDKVAAATITASNIASATVTPDKWTNPYCFGVSNNAAVTMSGGTNVKMTWAVEDWDLNSNFASNKYTVPVAGIYHFDAGVEFAAGNEAARLVLYVNGVAAKYGQMFDGNGPTYTGSTGPGRETDISADLKLAATDYVEIYAYTDDGSNTTSNVSTSWFNGHLVTRTFAVLN